MSLSKYLQSQEILQYVPGKKPDELRSFILDKGLDWYIQHPEESERIKNNLCCLDISASDDLIMDIQKHVILHYYEKILPLCGSPEFYYNFLNDNVDLKDAINTLKKAINEGNGILIAAAHFGGVELIVPCLSMHKLPLHIALRFTTEQFSSIAHKVAEKMAASGFFDQIIFIEVGKPGTMAALDMAGVLRKKEVLISVFDEKTDYSIPVKLFGKEVWGGAGLDRLLRFTKTEVSVFNAFMIRTDTGTYQLKVIEINIVTENPVQSMFANLEKIVEDNLEQWYFLHEEIPFVDQEAGV